MLYFGRNTPGGTEPSDSAWQQFVDEVVTPRFPAGLLRERVPTWSRF